MFGACEIGTLAEITKDAQGTGRRTDEKRRKHKSGKKYKSRKP